MTLIIFITTCIVLFWIVYFLIGTPLVIWDKIQDYRNGDMPKSEKSLWKIAIIIWAITFTFILMVSRIQ